MRREEEEEEGGKVWKLCVYGWLWFWVWISMETRDLYGDVWIFGLLYGLVWIKMVWYGY